MGKHKVLLVGCGQLGSRHLQAVASLDNVAEIHVIDPSSQSLEMGKSRLGEIADLNKNIKFYWSNEFNNASLGGDLCIVATQARGRSNLVKRVAKELGYEYFLIEKIVVQSIKEYRDLLKFCKDNKLSVWVNCKTRTYSIHKYIKSRLDPGQPIIFTMIAGNHGLASNGIHAADLFAFYDGSDQIKSAGARIDPVSHTSKRGQKELSGTLLGYTEKGSDFVLSFSGNHISPDCVFIQGGRSRFIIDHVRKFAQESYSDLDWKWKKVSIKENWAVSHMTKAFARDILGKGRCDLPTLNECFPAHQFILAELLPHFNRLLGTSYDYCPVT